LLKRTIATAVVLLSAVSADAQYFGRNKVQYDRFQFAILETAHFDVYYYAEERSAAEVAAQMAERWYDRLSLALDHTFTRRQPIILYASHSHFTQTSILEDGGSVVIAWTWAASHTGDIAGFAATGARLTMSGLTLYDFDDEDRITGHWQVVDRLSVFQQLTQNAAKSV